MAKLNLVPHQVAKHSPHRPQLLEFIEDQLHDTAGLFVRFQQDFARRRLDVADRHLQEQVSACRLVVAATLQPVA